MPRRAFSAVFRPFSPFLPAPLFARNASSRSEERSSERSSGRFSSAAPIFSPEREAVRTVLCRGETRTEGKTTAFLPGKASTVHPDRPPPARSVPSPANDSAPGTRKTVPGRLASALLFPEFTRVPRFSAVSPFQPGRRERGRGTPVTGRRLFGKVHTFFPSARPLCPPFPGEKAGRGREKPPGRRLSAPFCRDFRVPRAFSFFAVSARKAEKWKGHPGDRPSVRACPDRKAAERRASHP